METVGSVTEQHQMPLAAAVLCQTCHPLKHASGSSEDFSRPGAGGAPPTEKRETSNFAERDQACTV